jgi:hypothetical protein
MTTPGARAAQQAYQQQVQQNSANFRRNAAYQDHLRYRRQHRRGPVSVVLRLLGFVFSLVFIAIAVGIFLLILGSAQPDWFDHVRSWFDSI